MKRSEVLNDCLCQVLTLQGPWSERDAQMTETFARLQDIYGAGRVLGILGGYQRDRLEHIGNAEFDI